MIYPHFLIFLLAYHNLVQSSEGENCLGYNSKDSSCVRCSYDYYQSNYLVNILQENDQIFSTDCLSKNNSVVFQRNILIIKNASCEQCAQVFDFQYENLFDTFINETYFLSKLYGSQLNIYFSNENHELNANEPNNGFYYKFFRGIQSKILLTPVFCDEFPMLNSICFSTGNYITINVNFINFSVYISQSFTMQNIQLEGDFLFLNSVLQSLFILENIFDTYDIEEIIIPSFILNNTSVLNLYAYGLLEIQSIGGYVVFFNVNIENSWFIGGLITKTKNVVDLLSFFQNDAVNANLKNESLILNINENSLLNMAFLTIYNYSGFNAIDSSIFVLINWGVNSSFENCFFSLMKANQTLSIFNLSEANYLGANAFFSNVTINNCSNLIVLVSNSYFINATIFNMIFSPKINGYMLFDLNNSFLYWNDSNSIGSTNFLSSSLFSLNQSNFFGSNISFLNFQNVDSLIYANCSIVHLQQIYFQNISVATTIFNFISSDFILEQSFFITISTNQSFFIFNGFNLPILQHLSFQNINAPNIFSFVAFDKLNLESISVLQNNNINYFIAPNSQINTITMTNLFLNGTTMISLITSIYSYVILNMTDSYFSYLTILNAKYWTYISEGLVSLENISFFNIQGDYKLRAVFELELCDSANVNNSKFIMINCPLYLAGRFRQLCFWHCSIVEIQNSIFYNNELLTFGFVYIEQLWGPFTCRNNSFLGAINQPQIPIIAIDSEEISYIFSENNIFANLNCPPISLDSELKVISGVVSYFGEQTYSKLFNNYVFIGNNDTYENCSCYSGGSLGVININTINLSNFSFFNSKAFYEGGSLFVMSCGTVILDQISIKNSSAIYGSVLSISQTDKFELINSKILKSMGNFSGIIDCEITSILLINETYVSDSRSEIGGFVRMLGGFLGIFNSDFEKMQVSSMGGLLYLDNSLNLSMENNTCNTIISKNMAGMILGEIVNVITIRNLTLINSGSIVIGAAFVFNNMDQLLIDGSLFMGCECQGNGLISFYSANEMNFNYIVRNSKFINNSAILGNIILFESSVPLLLENVDCFNNKGNLLYFDYSYSVVIEINNGNFSNNDLFTNGEGGVIQAFNINLTLQNSTFHQNSINLYTIYAFTSSIIMNYVYFDLPLDFQNFNSSSIITKGLVYLESSFVFISFSFFRLFDNFYECPIEKYFILTLLNSQAEMNNCLVIGALGTESSKILFLQTNAILEMNIFIGNNPCLFEIQNSDIKLNLSYFEDEVNQQCSKNTLNAFIIQNDFTHSNSIFLQNSTFFFSFGTCFYIENLAVFSMNNVKLLNINDNSSSTKGLYFSLMTSSKILITENLFYGLIDSQGSAIEINKAATNLFNESSLILTDSLLIECSSFAGATIFTKELLEGIFIGNKFLSNTAIINSMSLLDSGFGGVAVFLCSSLIDCIFNISNNEFSNNSAEFFAATLYSDFTLLLFDNFFEFNSDGINFTNKTTSLPPQIQLSDCCDFEISSGTHLNFSASLIDNFDQKLIYDSSSIATIEHWANQTNFINKIENSLTIIHQGDALFINLLIIGKPESIGNIDILIKFQDPFGNALQLQKTLNLSIKKCSVGEVYNLEICYPCPQNYYSLEDPTPFVKNNIFQSCTACPENTLCPGLNYILPSPGYWRHSIDSMKMIKCLNSDFCLGLAMNLTLDEISNNLSFFAENYAEIFLGSCFLGHEKNLCQECQVGFGKSDSMSICQKCEDLKTLTIVRLSSIFVVVMIYLFFASNPNKKKAEMNSISIILKIVINHLQKISILAQDLLKSNVLSGQERSSFDSVSFLSFLSENTFVNDCILQNSFPQSRQYFYIIKITITFILPFMATCLLIAFLLFYNCFSHFNFKKVSSLKLRMILSLLIALFLFYPSITNLCFSLMNCINLDVSENKFLFKSPNLECGTSQYVIILASFGFPGIIFVGLGYPLFLVFLVFKFRIWNKFANKYTESIFNIPKTNLISSFRSKITSQKVSGKKGKQIQKRQENLELPILIFKSSSFFYKDYKDQYLYWESVIFLLKFGMALILNLDDAIYLEGKDMLYLVLLFIYFGFIMKANPFQEAYMNQLEMLAISIAILSRMFFSIYASEKKLIFFVISIVINIFFLTVALVVLIKYIQGKRMLNKIKAHFSDMVNFMESTRKKYNDLKNRESISKRIEKSIK